MEVGSRVRDKNNNNIGIIERQNNTSFLVSFEGGRKLWRKAHELEPETKARSFLVPKSTAPPKAPTTTQKTQQAQPQTQTQPHAHPQAQVQPQQTPPQTQQQRVPTGGGRTNLGGGSAPSVQPRAALGGGGGSPVPLAAPPRPSLGGGTAPAPSSPQALRNANIAPAPTKAHYDSTDNRNNNSNGSSSNNKVEVVVNTPIAKPLSSESGSPAAAAPPVEPAKPSTDHASSMLEEMWNIVWEELDFGDVIGSGKFGEVYIGTYLGTPVAIKKILESDEDTKQSIERELLMLKHVRHPNIVQFLGLCQHKGDIYFITEYMDRGDLFDILFFGDSPLTWKIKLKIALDVAMPCYYLQAKNILHRDLKSQNILISSADYKAKLCDLGLARALDTASRRMTFVGTDRWMAPEICLGIDYDYKVDVFSYGVVLMEIITQAVPDERRAVDKFGFNEGAFRSKVPKSCPPAFAQLAIDCTKLDARTRPSFKSVMERVKRLYEEQPDDQ